MDSFDDDSVLSSTQQVTKTIIDCAKNIKSNDATFKISTLPTVTDRLGVAMKKYVDTISKMKASVKASARVKDMISAIEDDEGEDQFIDMEKYTASFKRFVKEETKKNSQAETSALADLNRIIRPNDDEIQFEAPEKQIPKDPITKKDIRYAVKSTTCNHIYDQEGIEEYFSQKISNKKRVQCPVAGCTNRNMTKKELIPDDETNELIDSLKNN